MIIEKRIGIHYIVFGKQGGFGLGISVNKYCINLDLIKWYIAIEFGQKFR